MTSFALSATTVAHASTPGSIFSVMLGLVQFSTIQDVDEIFSSDLTFRLAWRLLVELNITDSNYLLMTAGFFMEPHLLLEIKIRNF